MSHSRLRNISSPVCRFEVREFEQRRGRGLRSYFAKAARTRAPRPRNRFTGSFA